MAKGYSGSYYSRCRCCSSGPKRKFLCRECDHVCKATEGMTPLCPYCRKPMLDMGERWRPGKKGHREGESLEEIRHRHKRIYKPEWRGMELLRKIMGKKK